MTAVDDKKWERYGALGGIVFVVLTLIGTYMVPTPPATNASALKLGNWFRDNHSGIAAASYIQVVATLMLLWWAGTLWSALRRASYREARLAVVAVGSVFVVAALTAVAAAATATTALRVDDLTDPGVKIFATLSFSLLAAATVAVAAHAGAVSAVAARTGFLPKWLSWLGALVAVLSVLGGLALTSDSTGVAAIAFVAYLAWLLWIVCVSVVLSRGDKPAVSAAEPPSEESEPAAPSHP